MYIIFLIYIYINIVGRFNVNWLHFDCCSMNSIVAFVNSLSIYTFLILQFEKFIH